MKVSCLGTHAAFRLALQWATVTMSNSILELYSLPVWLSQILECAEVILRHMAFHSHVTLL